MSADKLCQIVFFTFFPDLKTRKLFTFKQTHFKMHAVQGE